MDKKIFGILTALFLGLVVFGVMFLLLPIKQALFLGLIASLVALWTNEALPLGVVSLLPIILFPMLDINTTNEVSNQYSKSIIFLFLGGFMLAIAVEKTELHKVIAHKILRLFPRTIRGIVYALTITSGILSSCLSNTTTTLLLIPLAIYLTEDKVLKLRFALAVAYGSSIGGILTPIGTAPNLILLGIFDAKGIESITFMQWIIMVFPLATIMFVVVGYILSLGLKHHKLDLMKPQKDISRHQKRVLIVLVGLFILLLVNSPFKPFYNGLGFNEKGILLAAGLLMFFPPLSILKWEDSKKIPFEIIFLFGAGFSIALGFTSTGLADTLASLLMGFTQLPPVILLALVAGLVTFTTEITSNTALTSMLLPVIYAICIKANLDKSLFMMVATISASYAFMLPIATPPNAIAMSSGVVPVKSMMKFGVLFNFIGIFFVTLVAISYWNYML